MMGWLGANMVGWMIGIFGGLFRSYGEIFTRLSSIIDLSHLPDAILVTSSLICIPLGVGLGLMQSIQMSRWKIPAARWIIGTALGWIIPPLVFSQIRFQLLFGPPLGDDFVKYLELLWILYPTGLLLAGGGIGLLQILVSGLAVSKPRFWILSNALGLLAFGLLSRSEKVL